MDIQSYAPFVLVELAREWIMDVVPNLDDVEEASDDDLMRFVAKHYEGGVIAFAADAYADHGYSTLAAALRDH